MKKLMLVFSSILVISMAACASPMEKEPVNTEDRVIVSEEVLVSSDTKAENVSQNLDIKKGREEDNANSEQEAVIQQEEEGTDGIVETYQSTLCYQIEYYIDSFTVKNENGADIFIAENYDPDLYPDVYLNISSNQLPLKKTSSGQKEVKDEEGNVIGYLESDKKVKQLDSLKIGEYKVYRFEDQEGEEWNSAVRYYYFLKTESIVYKFETQCFLEAEEGYGEKLLNMIKTFKLN